MPLQRQKVFQVTSNIGLLCCICPGRQMNAMLVNRTCHHVNEQQFCNNKIFLIFFKTSTEQIRWGKIPNTKLYTVKQLS